MIHNLIKQFTAWHKKFSHYASIKLNAFRHLFSKLCWHNQHLPTNIGKYAAIVSTFPLLFSSWASSSYQTRESIVKQPLLWSFSKESYFPKLIIPFIVKFVCSYSYICAYKINFWSEILASDQLNSHLYIYF